MPGGTRPPVWNLQADAILFVIRGQVELCIYAGSKLDGITPEKSYPLDEDKATFYKKLGPNEIAYIPSGATYFFREVNCGNSSVHLSFSSPEWDEVELRSGLSHFTAPERSASLNT